MSVATAASPKERALINAVTGRPDIRFFLIHGQDSSAITDIAAAMGTAMGADAERIDMDSAKIKDDPALLADEASALSLFGGSRFIRLDFRREEGLAAVENLLALPKGNPVIATAGNLTKASKLRKLAESAPNAMAHICYMPEEGDAAALAMSQAASAGLKLDRALAARIARYTGQDRRLAAAEVEKLALFYDASPSRPVTVNPEDFTALSAETGEENIGALVHSVMGGELRRAGVELLQAREMGVDAIRIIRAMQRRVTLLGSLRGKVDKGTAIGPLVKATKSIFWKEESEYVRQLSRWPSSRLAGLAGHLLELEGRLMSAREGAAIVIMEEELLRIARIASRLG